jgi:hypothetical protein
VEHILGHGLHELVHWKEKILIHFGGAVDSIILSRLSHFSAIHAFVVIAISLLNIFM